MPTTAPTGSLEVVASVLAHYAARGDTTAAQRLLRANLHAPRGDRRLTTVRAQAGGIARNTPTPWVVQAALATVEQHQHLGETDCRALLRAAGLGGGAGAPLPSGSRNPQRPGPVEQLRPWPGRRCPQFAERTSSTTTHCLDLMEDAALFAIPKDYLPCPTRRRPHPFVSRVADLIICRHARTAARTNDNHSHAVVAATPH